jgi:hypothetical protein
MTINRAIQVTSNAVFRLGLLASSTWIFLIQLAIKHDTKIYEILMTPVWIGWGVWLIYKHRYEKILLRKFK